MKFDDGSFKDLKEENIFLVEEEQPEPEEKKVHRPVNYQYLARLGTPRKHAESHSPEAPHSDNEEGFSGTKAKERSDSAPAVPRLRYLACLPGAASGVTPKKLACSRGRP